MKYCTECKIEKNLSEFDVNRNNSISGYCKECRRKKMREHYANNKNYYITKAKKNSKKYLHKYTDYKKNLSCTDCNLSFKNEPYLCDFHHLNNEDKEYNTGNLRDSFKKFLKEVEKCIPLCANCHRRRHHAPLA